MQRFLFILIIGLMAAKAQSYDYYPGALGLAGSNQGYAIGVNALRTNPANLLLPRKGTSELVFLLPSASIFFFNGEITNKTLYYYNYHYWGFYPLWFMIQSSSRGQDAFKSGAQDRALSEMQNDTYFNLGLNYDLLGITIGRWGFRSTLMSYTRFYANGDELNMINYNSKDENEIQDPLFSDYTTAPAQSALNKSEIWHLSAIENSFGFAIPIPERQIPFNSIFDMPKASIGMNFKYLMGLGYTHLKPHITARDTLGVTKIYGLPGDPAQSYIDWTSAGISGVIAHDSLGLNDAGYNIAGHGFAFDLGMSWFDEQTSYSISLNNILGFIFWNKNQYSDIVYMRNPVGQMLNPNGSTLDTNNINFDDGVRYFTDGSTGSPQRLKEKKGMITAYPTTLNFGYAHRIPLDTRVNWLSKSVMFSAAIQQGFWNSSMTSTVPRISAGVQNGFLWDVVPLRLGIAFGGDEAYTFSAGFGLDLQYLVFDAGIRGYQSIFDKNSKGVAFAAGFKYVWGFDGDNDRDGILNSRDRCDDLAEDFDGFQDEDGCPDYDNDGDGIPDTLDRCPRTREDMDGFEDEDGCPDWDNDGDGIVDSLDQCVMNPEDRDGFEDQDGCPEYDNDGDGIPDSLDQCPNEPGPGSNHGCPVMDRDGDGILDSLDHCPDHAGPKENHGCPVFDRDQDGTPDSLDHCPDQPGPAANQGCPVTDRDQDGIPDSVDQCPEAPETYNNYEDEDGCPDTPPAPKKEEEKQIKQALMGVQFKVNSFEILESTVGQLDQIVLILQNYKHLRYVIEGHTDISGDYDYNMVLSRMRAQSVKDHLLQKGISSEQFIVIGYGPDKPIASNKTSAGRKQNRRIEFVQVLTRDDLTKLKEQSELNQQKIDEIFKSKPEYRKKLGL